jgi:hypothetical protein
VNGDATLPVLRIPPTSLFGQTIPPTSLFGQTHDFTALRFLGMSGKFDFYFLSQKIILDVQTPNAT